MGRGEASMNERSKLGRYTLQRKIAVGGMAEIWLAHVDGPDGRPQTVVVKRILPHLGQDSKFVGMFQDEARTAALLDHPNIVRVWELDEDHGIPFISMEYIDGPDLDYIIDRANQLGILIPVPIAVRIVADALAGLDHAHNFTDTDGQRLGLVHRDVSPHNVLVSSLGEVKVCDFGVAKAATSRHKTQTGAIKGKFAYMSPEQIADQPLDARSDIFSMGIVLYELTTNQRPFGDVSELLAVTAILTQEPKDPSAYVDDYPMALLKIVKRALTKDRSARYPSAQAMRQDLELYLYERNLLADSQEVAAFLGDMLSDRPSFLEPEEPAPPLRPRYEEDGRHLLPPHQSQPGKPLQRVPSKPYPWPPPERRVATPKPDAAPKTDAPMLSPISEPIDVADTTPDPIPAPETSTERFSSNTQEANLGKGKPVQALVRVLAVVAALSILVVVAGGAWVVYAHIDVQELLGIEADDGKDEPDDADPDNKDTKNAGKGTKDDPEDAKVGVLVVNSKPKTQVYLKDKRLGKTPDNFKLPIGKHKVRLVNERMGISKTIKVRIKPPPEITTVYEVFATGTLKLDFITDNPYTVYINGERYKGDIHKPIKLIEGKHTIKVRNTTGQDIEKPVTIKADGEVKLPIRI